ncbi:uncharacterized protein LOC125761781 [Anopheles funestus]|uniref:uncharacterized protein LOC125761781 n=1 Tax=Anopheles funestus TaxID=62324 RepID=UPI0020C662B6|nr:uncharacterized protein LOC125761781 [Anopheles funestus]
MHPAVFVRNDNVQSTMTTPYQGPYRILQRSLKFFQILVNGQPSQIYIDRLKPAYTTDDPPDLTRRRKEPMDNSVSVEQPSRTQEPTSSLASPQTAERATTRNQPTPILPQKEDDNISTGVTRPQRRVIIPLRYR